jgi:D-alanyl-D-alanine endopeptidase (penicillin-binding protein 7)
MKKLIALLTLVLCIESVPATDSSVTPNSRRAEVLRLWQHLEADRLRLKSRSALVADQFGNELYAKAAQTTLPIASITKLMTAMVILDARLPMDESIVITKADRDLLRNTGSRLPIGSSLTRHELLTLALMASENRASAALARTSYGGTEQFVQRMNLKARLLGLQETRFVDATGLDAGNVSTARDLARMIQAASRYPKIRAATTQASLQVKPLKGRGSLRFVNTNRLIRSAAWNIELSKTGYINEAGRCLVMLTAFEGEPLIFVLLNAYGKLTPIGDANRIRKWLRKGLDQAMEVAVDTTLVPRFLTLEHGLVDLRR